MPCRIVSDTGFDYVRRESSGALEATQRQLFHLCDAVHTRHPDSGPEAMQHVSEEEEQPLEDVCATQRRLFYT